MRARHKIFDALKDAPEDWRYVKCTQKRAWGNKYKEHTTYTLEEVLEQDGDGVGVLLGRHSLTTINGKRYGLGAVDFDGTDSDLSFEHHVGFPAEQLTKTVTVSSGKKDRKQMLYWIPEDYLDLLDAKELSLEGCSNFELRIGNQYSMVAGAHDETPGYFWVNSPAETDIAIAPLLLLEGWEELSKKKKKTKFSRRIKRSELEINTNIGLVPRYLERYYSPANNYSDYDSWIKVLMALHHLSCLFDSIFPSFCNCYPSFVYETFVLTMPISGHCLITNVFLLCPHVIQLGSIVKHFCHYIFIIYNF